MKNWLLIVALMSLPLLAFGQTIGQIKSDPAILWAEGTGARPSRADDAALEMLVRKLSFTDELPFDSSVRTALWRTYLTDIKAVSGMITSSSGVVCRYLAMKDIPRVFDNRWRKVRELAASAEQASRRGETDIARTYCNWAMVYLSSLPQGEYSLRRRVSELRDKLGEGNVNALRMRNIEAETEAICEAFGVHHVSSPPARPVPSGTSPRKEPAAAPVAVERKQSTRLPLPVKLVSPDLEMPVNLLADVPRKCVGMNSPVPMPEKRFEPRVYAVAEIGRIPAFGLMAVGVYGRFGGYVSFRRSFANSSSDYQCTSDGKTDFGWMWASGRTRNSRLSACGGAVASITKKMFAYAGAGFGSDTVLWEDTDGKWARVSDNSCRGFLMDAGILFDVGRLSFGIGVCALKLKDYSGVVSAGYRF